MKKVFLVVFLLSTLFLITSCGDENHSHNFENGVCTVCGVNEDSTELSFALNDDGTGYVLTDIGECTDKKIFIPESFKGLPVIAIGNSAFEDCTTVQRITIPDSVVSIGVFAFSQCTALKRVNFGENSQLTAIANSAFSGCTSIKTFEIPDGVTSIGSGAFSSCTSLTGITIPDSIEYIGFDAFINCTSLIYNLYGNAKYLGNKNNSFVVLTESISKNINFCMIHENTKIIYHYSFRNCESLTSISIPESLTSIGYAAFRNCSSLTDVYFGHNSQLTNIDDMAFFDCISLKNFTIPDTVTSIGRTVFANCISLNFAVYDEALYIGSTENPYFLLAKARSTDITSCHIHEKTRFIHSAAFVNCTELTEVTIPSNVIKIGLVAFEQCISLKAVNISDVEAWCKIKFDSLSDTSNPLVYAGNLYLNGNLVTELIIPQTVTTIENSAFLNCTSITSVTIPESVTYIGNFAFQNCSSLTSVTISGSVTSIGYSAFQNCSSLTSVTIPDSVISIGYSAFQNCSSLTSVTIPDSVISIGNFSFEGCSSLETVYLSENSKLQSLETCIFAKCTSLKSIIIPDSVISIGNAAFYDCSSLESVTIPDSVTSIEHSAFENCSSLESIKLGSDSHLNKIASCAFLNCISLTKINIPETVNIIEIKAFYGCNTLKSAVFEKSSGWVAINGNISENLYLPTSSVAANGLTSTYVNSEWRCE